MSNSNIHKGHRARLRKLAENTGIVNLEEHQALELLLTYVVPQKDVNPIAHNLINKFGSFSGVLDAKVADLTKVKGIGVRTAQFLSSFKEFFFLYKQNRRNKRAVIKNTLDAVNFIKDILNDKPYEELYVICIDGVNNVKLFEQISKGNSNTTNVNIRKITEIVLSSNTHNIIICHNHPDGSCQPSLADDKLTRALVMGLSLNNITLLDHIIIGVNDYYSYNLSGKLNDYCNEIKNLINYEAFMQNMCKYN